LLLLYVLHLVFLIQVMGQTPMYHSGYIDAAVPSQKPRAEPTRPRKSDGEDEVIRVHTTLVTVPLTVLDRKGSYVPDLRAEEFHVFENGVEQHVAHFASVDRPFTVALLLDTSDSLRFRLEDIREAAIAFVDQLRPADRVTVLSFYSQIDVLCEPTSDHNSMRHAIGRTRTGGGTRLYDAVEFIIKHRLSLERDRGARKAVVLFSDGVDTGSFQATSKSSVHDVEESDVLIYPVQYFSQPDAAGQLRAATSSSATATGGATLPVTGSAPDANTRARADTYLLDLARKTGTRPYRAETLAGLQAAFARIAAELRAQYSIGYYPELLLKPGERGKIKVRVDRRDVAVRARTSYVARALQSN
jgi:VWFA-related protein